MKDIITKVAQLYPGTTFTAGKEFCWSFNALTITYPTTSMPRELFIASLCHELGHAECSHSTFSSDVHLMQLEKQAWAEAAVIAQKVFDVTIPDTHIEKCLDTYRDWLYTRAVCPACKQCGVQFLSNKYRCIFCNTAWLVNQSRLCNVIKKRI